MPAPCSGAASSQLMLLIALPSVALIGLVTTHTLVPDHLNMELLLSPQYTGEVVNIEPGLTRFQVKNRLPVFIHISILCNAWCAFAVNKRCHVAPYHKAHVMCPVVAGQCKLWQCRKATAGAAAGGRASQSQCFCSTPAQDARKQKQKAKKQKQKAKRQLAPASTPAPEPAAAQVRPSQAASQPVDRTKLLEGHAVSSPDASSDPSGLFSNGRPETSTLPANVTAYDIHDRQQSYVER